MVTVAVLGLIGGLWAGVLLALSVGQAAYDLGRRAGFEHGLWSDPVTVVLERQAEDAGDR